MNPYLQPLIESCRAASNPEKALQMKQYLRNQFDFFGITAPKKDEISKQFIKKYGLPNNLDEVVKELWEMPQRECQYFAMTLLERNVKNMNLKSIDLLVYTITTKSWWDTVDLIASRLVGEYFKKFPEQILPQTQKMMDSGNMWLQRTALLFQLKYKTKTDTQLLFNYIEQLKDSKEFFIQKAIGWILREYSKTNPQTVIDFVNQTVLAPLSKREALKIINKKQI